jgi:predicted nucleotidyltransferase
MPYQDLFIALNTAQVRYLVVGGVAMVLHGAVRMTADLDLAISLKNWATALKFRFYRMILPTQSTGKSGKKRRI